VNFDVPKHRLPAKVLVHKGSSVRSITKEESIY
jgi:hypothetical protein